MSKFWTRWMPSPLLLFLLPLVGFFSSTLTSPLGISGWWMYCVGFWMLHQKNPTPTNVAWFCFILALYLFPLTCPLSLLLAILEILSFLIPPTWSLGALLSRRIFRLGFALIGMVLIWFVSYGTWNIFQGELYGNYFDELGLRLLRGYTDIDKNIFTGEAIIHNGKAYTNFGMLPAIAHALPDVFFPWIYGQLSRFFCSVAAMGSLLAFSLIMHDALESNVGLSSQNRNVWLVLMLCGFGLGSPVLFLMSCGYIYHEGFLWGLVGSMWSLYFFLKWEKNRLPPSAWILLGFSVSTAITALSKITFGIPYILLSIVMILREVKNVSHRRAIRWLCFSPLILALVFQAWYNFNRFQSILIFMPLAEYPLYAQSQPQWIPIAFDPARWFLAFSHIFRLGSDYFSTKPPFISPGPGLSFDMVDPYLEWLVPFPLLSPWIVVLGAAGIFHLFRKETRWIYKIAFYCLSVEILLILSFFFQTQRYFTEFLPMGVFLLAVFLMNYQFKEKSQKILLFFTTILCVVSVGMTIASTISISAYWNWGIPTYYQEFLRRLFA